MKLNDKQFARFRELMKLKKDGKISSEEEKELAELQAIKNTKGSNDLSWWKNYPALLKDVVNLPFNWIPGTRVDITGVGNASDTLKLGVIAIMKIRPAIGLSTSDADAFNAQVRQLWLDLHRKYRGIGTYEKSDLGIALLAIESAFETLAKFERIYGVINTYKIGNRVVPAGLKEALGISNNLEENLADFRYMLNYYITKMKQLCLPKGMGVLQSDIVSIGNLFKDSENERAFIFGFDTELYGVYDPTAITTGGSVQYRKFNLQKTGLTPGNRLAFTLTDVSTILDTVVGALLNDDDIARICSDLLAAYGPENVMQLIEVPENYTVSPVHDYERLIQFHNATVCGEVASIYDDGVVTASDADTYLNAGIPIVIYQNNNTVMCRLGRTDSTANNYVTVGGLNYPSYNANNIEGHGKEGDVIFDTWVDNPGEMEIMCGTRYTSLCSTRVLISTNVYRQALIAFGTKVCSQLEIFRCVSSGTYTSTVIHSTVVNTVAVSIPDLFAILQMDWHPTLYVIDSNNDMELFGDIDNFTKIDASNLRRLHEVALLSGYKFAVVSNA